MFALRVRSLRSRPLRIRFSTDVSPGWNARLLTPDTLLDAHEETLVSLVACPEPQGEPRARAECVVRVDSHEVLRVDVTALGERPRRESIGGEASARRGLVVLRGAA